jgi:hypothetical protein
VPRPDSDVSRRLSRISVAASPCRISRCGQYSTLFRRSSRPRDRCGCSCASGRSLCAPWCGIDTGFLAAVSAHMATVVAVATTGRGVGRAHISSPQSARWFSSALRHGFWAAQIRTVMFATYPCRPVTCSPPARYSWRPCLTFGEALSGESPNVQRTHHSMKGRVIPVLSMVRRVQKVCEPFPHYPFIAGSLNDHHLVRERTRMEFRAVRHTWSERRRFAVQIRPGVSPDSTRVHPWSAEYRSPPARPNWPQAAVS